MIVSTKPYVLIYKDGTVQNIIKENSGKVYPSATSGMQNSTPSRK